MNGSRSLAAALLAAAALLPGALRAGEDEGGARAPELDGAVGWVGTEKPIRLADLRGKVVLLDFWTYG